MAATKVAEMKNQKSCYILSFDGGGSKGVIELVLLKRSFDYLSILLSNRPEIATWVCVKSNKEKENIRTDLGGTDKVLDVMEVRKYTSENFSSGQNFFTRIFHRDKRKMKNQFVVAMKTVCDKFKVLEDKKTQENYIITDFINFWLDRWYLVKKEEEKCHDEFWSNTLLTELGIKCFKKLDFDDKYTLVRPDLNIDISSEAREKFTKFVHDLGEKIAMSKLIECIHPCDCFDIIVGTSTGAMIACGLVGGSKDHLPMSVEECIHTYRENTVKIFTGTRGNWLRSKLGMASLLFSRYKYTQESLKQILTDQFGEKTSLAELTQSHLYPQKTIAAAVAREIGVFNEELVLFDTVSLETRATNVVEALLASTAAPVYFKTPVRIADKSFVDGGVGGNCPLKQVLPLAKSHFSRVDFVLSVAPPLNEKESPNSGLSWLMYFADLTTNGKAEYDFLKKTERDTYFVRLYPNLHISSQQRSKFERFHKFKLDTLDVTGMISITENWLNLPSSLAYSLFSVLPIMRRMFYAKDQEYQKNHAHRIIAFLKTSGEYAYNNRILLGLVEVREHLQKCHFWIEDLIGAPDTSPKDHTQLQQLHDWIEQISNGTFFDDLKQSLHDYAEINCYIGTCFNEEKHIQEALKYQKMSLYIELKLHTEACHNHIARCLDGIGLCLQSEISYKEALEHHRIASEIMHRIHKDSIPEQSEFYPPEYASAVKHYGTCLYCTKDYSKALEQYKISKKVSRRKLDIARSYINMGLCLERLSQVKKAIEKYEKALEIAESVPKKDKSEVIAIAQNNIGMLHLRQENFIEALQYFKKSLSIRKKGLQNIRSEQVAENRYNIACCYKGLKNEAEAKKWYLQSLEMFQTVYHGCDNHKIVACLFEIASCLENESKIQDGRSYKSQANLMKNRLSFDQQDDYKTKADNESGTLHKEVLRKIDQCVISSSNKEIAKGGTPMNQCSQKLYLFPGEYCCFQGFGM